ncbi:MAG: DUF5683 domain-containing protein, partial [Rikenellaceae bacterium]|nr:DUF5683 domain-containing protein [Rikenellaceae bacterium]
MKRCFILLMLLAAGAHCALAAPMLDGDRNKGFKVSGGVLRDAAPKKQHGDSTARDSLAVRADSIARDSLSRDGLALDSLSRNGAVSTAEDAARQIRQDSLATATPEELATAAPEGIVAGDTAHVRHNWMFRDSIPLSRMTLLSFPLPGFSQLYNSQAWKVPVLYASVGALVWGGIVENRR